MLAMCESADGSGRCIYLSEADAVAGCSKGRTGRGLLEFIGWEVPRNESAGVDPHRPLAV
jgi:hypothetical protein